MIKGIGVDWVEVHRFLQWHTYPYTKLHRIFSDQEIAYCLESVSTSAQRFAARFAAKEALVKALTTAGFACSLLSICRHASIVKDMYNKQPTFIITHDLKSIIHQDTVIHVSLSHTREHAIAFVIVNEYKKI